MFKNDFWFFDQLKFIFWPDRKMILYIFDLNYNDFHHLNWFSKKDFLPKLIFKKWFCILTQTWVDLHEFTSRANLTPNDFLPRLWASRYIQHFHITVTGCKSPIIAYYCNAGDRNVMHAPSEHPTYSKPVSPQAVLCYRSFGPQLPQACRRERHLPKDTNVECSACLGAATTPKSLKL